MTTHTASRINEHAAASHAQGDAAEHSLHSQESERMLLSVMMNPKRETLQHRLAELLGVDDYFVPQHQATWRIITSLREAGLPADPVSIADMAARQSEFIGGAQYLAGTADNQIANLASEESVTAAASRVKEFALLRRLQDTLRQGIALCESGQGFAAVTSFVDDDLQNLKRSAQSSRVGPQHIAHYYATITANMEAKLDGKEVDDAAKTGFDGLDEVIVGLLPETLTIIAGRPSMGKTALAINIEQNVALAGRPTLTFSLEMTGVAIATRGLARHAHIPLRSLKEAALSSHQWSQFAESMSALSTAQSYIDESPGLTLPEIRSRSRAFIAAHPNGVIIIDYLQLIAMTGGGDKRVHVAEVSAGLKLMARQLRCPVVALAQLSREVEKRTNKRPMLSDLGESGQIERDAEVIIFVYRDEFYNPDTPDKGVTEAIVGKNRDGETRTVKMGYYGATMTFTEMGTFEHA